MFSLENGINYNDLPMWQRRGVGIMNMQPEKQGFNPLSNEKTVTLRNELTAEFELPLGEDYKKFIANIICREGQNYL